MQSNDSDIVIQLNFLTASAEEVLLTRKRKEDSYIKNVLLKNEGTFMNKFF